jgi:HPt (histidine-containing phosphotransfer) domain-containing protein
MDGYTATRRLREHGLQIPILALTANVMKGAEKDVLDAGCSGFLVKPINIDNLLETLAALIGGTRVEHSVASASSTGASNNGGSMMSSSLPLRSRLAGNQRLRPAIRKFTARLDEQLRGFEVAYASGDFNELARLAHWLKGAAGTVGYDEFTEPATRLEEAAKDKAAPELGAAMAELRALASRLEAPGSEADMTEAGLSRDMHTPVRP